MYINEYILICKDFTFRNDNGIIYHHYRHETMTARSHRNSRSTSYTEKTTLQYVTWFIDKLIIDHFFKQFIP